MKTNFLILLFGIGGIIIMSVSGIFGLWHREINEEKTFAIDEINEIQVQLNTYPVHVIRAEAGSDVKFHLYGTAIQEVKLSAELDHQTAFVQAIHQLKGYLPNNLVLDVYIPEDYEKNLSIDITTGRVRLDDVKLANFSLHTTTGGLEAGQLIAENMNIATTTGGIRINAIEINQLEIIGRTGAVNLDDCVVERAKIQTTTGGVTVKNGVGNFNIEASTGDVLLNYKDFTDQSVSINTTTGGITLQLPADAEFSLQAQNTTGRLQSDFPVNRISDHEMAGQIGTKSNPVILKCSTGSITVLKK
jgi:lia operon protein LiaG